jgi:hypothetical protein
MSFAGHVTKRLCAASIPPRRRQPLGELVDRLLCIALALHLAPGCASTIAGTRPLSENSLAAINDAVEGRSGTVTLGAANERVEFAGDMTVGRETTAWSQEEPARVRKSVPTEALHSIEVTHRGRGAAEGLGAGILIGAVGGAILGGASDGKWCLEGTSCGAFPLAVGAAGGAIAGALVGVVVGTVIGHRVTVAFDVPPPRDPTPAQPGN